MKLDVDRSKKNIDMVKRVVGWLVVPARCWKRVLYDLLTLGLVLVITALVGTRDLGQEVYIALTKADPGRGLVAGRAQDRAGVGTGR